MDPKQAEQNAVDCEQWVISTMECMFERDVPALASIIGIPPPARYSDTWYKLLDSWIHKLNWETTLPALGIRVVRLDGIPKEFFAAIAPSPGSHLSEAIRMYAAGNLNFTWTRPLLSLALQWWEEHCQAAPSVAPTAKRKNWARQFKAPALKFYENYRVKQSADKLKLPPSYEKIYQSWKKTHEAVIAEPLVEGENFPPFAIWRDWISHRKSAATKKQTKKAR